MIIGLVLARTPGYSETFFKSKIQGLQDAGHQVVLFCGNTSENFHLCATKVLSKHYSNGLKQFLILFWVYLGLLPHFKTIYRFIVLERQDRVSLLSILKRLYNYAPIFKQKLDWLHFGFGTLVIGAEHLAASKGIQMAVSFRGFDIGVYPLKHPHCYEKVWKIVSKIHIISDDIGDLVNKQGFKNQVPMVKITPAINTQYFSSETELLWGQPLQIITVARLHWKKGLAYTLEALMLLKRKGIKFQFRIIGAGPEEEALKFQIYQYGLQDEIVFMGAIDHEAIKQALEKAHIYLQYSIQEGFCNAVLEAQSMGLLCIVSDAEGLAENVLDGLTGWVVPKRKPKDLARKIKEVFSLPRTKRQQIRSAAISRCQQEFNIKKQQLAFIEFYKD